MTSADLTLAVGALIEPSEIDARSLWDRLSTATGQRIAGSGHPTAKSRPPATLSVVALVMDVTQAAREGADDLAGRAHASVPANLYSIVDALDRTPDDDLIGWWTDAAHEWTARAQSLLGQSSSMIVRLYGARCPYCDATSVRVKQNAEMWLVPAITVEYGETGSVDPYSIQRVMCRSCEARWVRGDELGRLIDDVIARNYSTNR